jgi:hypothetical protein
MTVRGEKGPESLIVGGWVRGPFAIDERANETWLGKQSRRGKVWCITHLATGYAVRFVIGSRKVAQRMADELAAEADWNFHDPAEAKTRGAAVKAVMARNPSAFVDGSEAGPPVELQHESAPQ